MEFLRQWYNTLRDNKLCQVYVDYHHLLHLLRYMGFVEYEQGTSPFEKCASDPELLDSD